MYYNVKEFKKRLLYKAVNDEEKLLIHRIFRTRNVPEDYFRILSDEEKNWFLNHKQFKIVYKSKCTNEFECILEEDALPKVKRSFFTSISKIFFITPTYLYPTFLLYLYKDYVFHPAVSIVPKDYYNKFIIKYYKMNRTSERFTQVEYHKVFMDRLVNPIFRNETRLDILLDKSIAVLSEVDKDFADMCKKQIPNFKKAINFCSENVIDYKLIEKFQKVRKGGVVI